MAALGTGKKRHFKGDPHLQHEHKDKDDDCFPPKLGPGPFVSVGLVTVCTVLWLLGFPVFLLRGGELSRVVVSHYRITKTTHDSNMNFSRVWLLVGHSHASDSMEAGAQLRPG